MFSYGPANSPCQNDRNRVTNHSPNHLELYLLARIDEIVVSACQKIDIYVNPKNKWCFKIAKNFQVR